MPDLFADVSCHCFVYNVLKLLFQMSFSLHSVVKIFFFYAMRSRDGMWSCISTFFIFFCYLPIHLFIYILSSYFLQNSSVSQWSGDVSWYVCMLHSGWWTNKVEVFIANKIMKEPMRAWYLYQKLIVLCAYVLDYRLVQQPKEKSKAGPVQAWTIVVDPANNNNRQ